MPDGITGRFGATGLSLFSSFMGFASCRFEPSVPAIIQPPARCRKFLLAKATLRKGTIGPSRCDRVAGRRSAVGD